MLQKLNPIEKTHTLYIRALPVIFTSISLGFYPSPLIAQTTTSVTTTTTTVREAPNPDQISLYIQRTRPGQGASGIQEYRLKKGQTVFIPTGQTNPEQLQESAEAKAYKNQLGGVSQAVAQKIAQIQSKQHEIDTEIYPTYRAPLETEKRNLEIELEEIQDRKNQLESQKLANEAFKTPTNPVPKAIISKGITISVNVNKDMAIITITSEDRNPTTIEAPLNKWMVIYSSGQKGASEDILAKVESLNQ